MDTLWMRIGACGIGRLRHHSFVSRSDDYKAYVGTIQRIESSVQNLSGCAI